MVVNLRPKKIYLAILVSMLSGFITVFAFDPFSIYPLALVGPMACYWFWRQDQPGQAFLHGYLFSIGFYSFGAYWIYYVLKEMGKIDSPYAEVLSLMILLISGVNLGVVGYLFVHARRYFGTMICAGLLFPSLWFLNEYLLSVVFEFPFLSLGYSQVESPLSGWAPLFGVYGVGFLLVGSAALFIAAWYGCWKTRGIIFFLLMMIWSGGAYMKKVNWTSPLAEPIPIALVQTQDFHKNKEQRIKWKKYKELVVELWQENDVVLMPEAVFGLFGVKYDHEMLGYFQAADRQLKKNLWQTKQVRLDGQIEQLAVAIYQEKDFSEALENAANSDKKTAIFGIKIRDSANDLSFNTLIAYSSQQRDIYRKRHLAPFGEVFPGNQLFAEVWDWLGINASKIARGKAQRPLLTIAGYSATVAICFEAAFADELLTALPESAFIIVASRDRDYDHTLGLYQQLQMLRMRAIEQGRWLARAAQTGLTVIIDPKGKLVKQAPAHRFNVLTGHIVPMQGSTPYAFWGNVPVLAIATFFLLLMVIQWRLLKKKNNNSYVSVYDK